MTDAKVRESEFAPLRRRWRPVLIASLLPCGVHYAQQIDALKPYFSADPDWHPQITGWYWSFFQTLFVLPNLLASIFAGYLIDNVYSPATVSLVFLTLTVVGEFIFGYGTSVHNLRLAYAGRFVAGSGLGCVSLLSGTIIAHAFYHTRYSGEDGRAARKCVIFGLGITEMFHAVSDSASSVLGAPLIDRFHGHYWVAIYAAMLFCLASWLLGLIVFIWQARVVGVGRNLRDDADLHRHEAAQRVAAARRDSRDAAVVALSAAVSICGNVGDSEAAATRRNSASLLPSAFFRPQAEVSRDDHEHGDCSADKSGAGGSDATSSSLSQRLRAWFHEFNASSSGFWCALWFHLAFSSTRRLFGHVDMDFLHQSYGMELQEAGYYCGGMSSGGVILPLFCGLIFMRLRTRHERLQEEASSSSSVGEQVCGCAGRGAPPRRAALLAGEEAVWFAEEQVREHVKRVSLGILISCALAMSVSFALFAFAFQPIRVPVFLLTIVSGIEPTVLKGMVPLTTTHLATAYGIFETVECLAKICLSPLVGFLRDRVGDYNVDMILFSLILLTAVACGTYTMVFSWLGSERDVASRRAAARAASDATGREPSSQTREGAAPSDALLA